MHANDGDVIRDARNDARHDVGDDAWHVYDGDEPHDGNDGPDGIHGFHIWISR